MTTTQTPNLGLTKAVKGTAEPFSIDAANANLDILDEAVGDLQESVSQVKTYTFTKTDTTYFARFLLDIKKVGRVIVIRALSINVASVLNNTTLDIGFISDWGGETIHFACFASANFSSHCAVEVDIDHNGDVTATMRSCTPDVWLLGSTSCIV